MEPGQCSGAKGDRIWGTLVPSDSKFSEVDLKMRTTGVCSEISSSSREKGSWCEITKNSDKATSVAAIRNTSKSAILVDGAVVENGEVVDIKYGSKIVAGPDVKGYLHYTFKLKDDIYEKTCLKISLDVEHSKCSICLNIWHDVVTLAPCLHNFCNGCFSEWMKRSEKDHKSVICPQCRTSTISVGRNHFLHHIEEAILQDFPLLRRPDEELFALDKSALIQPNLVLNTRKAQSRKRPSSSRRGDFIGMDPCCPQCEFFTTSVSSQYGRFRCNPNTIHIQCHACGGMFPFRHHSRVPQNCKGCDRAFCGAYWPTQSFIAGDDDMYSTCGTENFKPIVEHRISRIPESAHENNQYEQAITEKCIQNTGTSLQALVSEWIVKFNDRELDRSRCPLNHADELSAQTYICTECYHRFVGYLLYWFRVSIPKTFLPAEASNREDCWYGYSCRTQHHNPEHASKRNHVCRPTSGNVGGI